MRINEHKGLNAHSTIIEKNETNSNTTYQLSASREFDTLALCEMHEQCNKTRLGFKSELTTVKVILFYDVH